jgi:hypothetical protein
MNIEEIIVKEYRHKNYKRTQEVKNLAYILATGDGQNEILTSLRKRETPEQKKQREDITNSITQVPISITQNYYNKVRRVSGVLKRIDTPDKARLEMLETQVYDFHDHQSLEEYIHDLMSYYTFYDPNAYLLILPDTIYNDTGAAIDIEINHKVIPSNEVAYIEEKRGRTIRIVTVKDREVKDSQGRKQKVHDYCEYEAGRVLEYTDITFEGEVGNLGFTDLLIENTKQTRRFAINEYINTSKQCPAISLRTYLDARTINETGVTPLEPAIPLLKKLINTNSLQELVMFLHTFPKRFLLTTKCKDPECDTGYYPDMSVCRTCKGTGADYHTSEQDIVMITVPDGALANEIPNLQNFSYTESPNIQTPEYLDRKVDSLIRSILLAIFNQEVYSMAEIAKTATEKMLEYQNIYDKLQPYTEKISIVYERVIQLIGDYYEINELEVQHSYPLDYQFETETDLISRYSAGRLAGISQEILNGYETKIIERQFRNNPYKVMLEKALMKYKPFSDKSESAIISILANRAQDDFDKVLWENWSKVREIIEREYEDFPYLTDQRQVDVLGQIVEGLEVKYIQPLNPVINLEEL